MLADVGLLFVSRRGKWTHKSVPWGAVSPWHPTAVHLGIRRGVLVNISGVSRGQDPHLVFFFLLILAQKFNIR